MKATEIKRLNERQRAYHVDPPIDGHSHVVSSRCHDRWAALAGWEVFLFPANANGEIVEMIELSGSLKG